MAGEKATPLQGVPAGVFCRASGRGRRRGLGNSGVRRWPPLKSKGSLQELRQPHVHDREGPLALWPAACSDADDPKSLGNRQNAAMISTTDVLLLPRPTSETLGQIASACLAPPPLPPLRRIGCSTGAPPPPPPTPPARPAPPTRPTAAMLDGQPPFSLTSRSRASLALASGCSSVPSSTPSTKDDRHSERISFTGIRPVSPAIESDLSSCMESDVGSTACESPVGRTRAVTFAPEESLCTVYEISPYAEIYGLHPRLFDFTRDFWMVPAKTSTKTSQGWRQRLQRCGLEDDESSEEDTDSDSDSDNESSSDSSDSSSCDRGTEREQDNIDASVEAEGVSTNACVASTDIRSQDEQAAAAAVM